MLGLSAEAWGAIGTIAGVVGAGAAAVIGWAANANKKSHNLEMEAIRARIDLQDDSVLKDIDRIEISLRKAWEYVDDLRINAVRRVDQDRLREEFRADVKALGDRLVAEITALRNDIHREQKGGA
jgi:hypothetical protein